MESSWLLTDDEIEQARDNANVWSESEERVIASSVANKVLSRVVERLIQIKAYYDVQRETDISILTGL